MSDTHAAVAPVEADGCSNVLETALTPIADQPAAAGEGPTAATGEGATAAAPERWMRRSIPSALDEAQHPFTALDEAQHPFETDPGDHAETPFEAYEHLDLLLTRLAKRLGTTKAALRIYDPYYCEGRMVEHMARLGYESVYNRNEDFYEVKAAGRCPEYDVLVTNPPFSGDHLERIFRFVVKSNKPWCLLVPQYVARKAFYLEWLNNQRPKGTPKPCFLAPTRQPYVFTAPNRADVREMRLADQGSTSNSSNDNNSSSSSNNSSNSVALASAEVALSGLSLTETAQHQGSSNPLPTTTAASPAAAVTQHAAVAATAARSNTSVSSATATATAPASATAKGAFDVAAGSFQCVWFVSLGERHHKPVLEWLQQQLQQQQQGEAAATSAGAGAGAGENGAAAAVGPGYVVVSTVKEVPQLMAAPKLTPAERRWRKKMAAAGGQPPDEDGQQQQQSGAGAGGRAAGGRQQQQQQGMGSRTGSGRQSSGRQRQQPVDGRGSRPTGGRQQQQQQQQQQTHSGFVPGRQGARQQL